MPRLNYAAAGSRMGGANLVRPGRFEDYKDLVLGTRRANLIAYWPLLEPSGTAIKDYSGRGCNGTVGAAGLQQVGIGDGKPGMFYDATHGPNDVYTATFRGLFNFQEYTILMWLKMYNAGVWTDATTREPLRIETNGTTDYVFYRKNNTNNQFRFATALNGTIKGWTFNVVGAPTYWLSAVLRCSKINDALDYFWNGVKGVTLNALGAVSVQPMYKALIGNFTSAPGGPHYGYIQHTAIWNTPLTDSEIYRLART